MVFSQDLIEAMFDGNYVHLSKGEILSIQKSALFPGDPEGIQTPRYLDEVLANAKKADRSGQSILQVAAVYGYGIAHSQCFFDGNTRTGFLSIMKFLDLNGYSTDGAKTEPIRKALIDARQHRPGFTVQSMANVLAKAFSSIVLKEDEFNFVTIAYLVEKYAYDLAILGGKL